MCVIIPLLIIGCSPKTCSDLQLTDDFYNDLASEDNRIGSELYLDVFNNNLDTLTYNYYIGYLSRHVAPSAEGLVETIQCADEKYLQAGKSDFVLVLLYKNKHTIVGDNSSTQVSVDSVYVYSPEGAAPSLKDFAEQLKH